MNNNKRKIKKSHILIHIILVFVSFLMLMPFVWMVLTSFKTITQSTQLDPFVILPTHWKLDNFKEVLSKMSFMKMYFTTSLMILGSVACAVCFSATAGYAFARLKFPGKNLVFGMVLFQMMVPAQIFIIPQYLMVSKLGLLNTVPALIFPGLVSAFGTFLLRQFFMGLPKELEEAALLDGCNIGQTFIKVMLPLAKSGLVALGIFTALFAFKSLMWPLIVNTNQNAMPLSAGLAKLNGQFTTNYPQLMAASLLAMWPMLLIYIIFQRKFIEGIATSGGKL